MGNKILTPRDFIKEKLGEEITWDNESDSCDYEWTIIEDLMSAYAQYLERASAKTSNENGALPIPDISDTLQHSDDMCFHECPECNCRCNCSTRPCSCCNDR